MQCLTDLIVLLVVEESTLKNPQSAWQYGYIRQFLQSDHPVFQLLPPYSIEHLWTPPCSWLWSRPNMTEVLFVIGATLHLKLFWILGGLKWLRARSGLLLGKILKMHRHGDSIYTAKSMRLADLVSDPSFVIKFFAIHQNIGPAQWGNICSQKLTSLSTTK